MYKDYSRTLPIEEYDALKSQPLLTPARQDRYVEKGKTYWKGIRIRRVMNPAVARDLRKGSR